jgi:hypothetical protein
MICALLYRFGEAADLPRQVANNAHYVEDLKALGNWREPPGEGEQRELLHLLEEEMASVGEELAYEEKANEERVAIEREACLAPPSETWNLLVRQEGSLDRSIDRKVRILLRLRKEFADYAFNPGGEDGGGLSESLEVVLDGDTPEDRELRGMLKKSKLQERSGNVAENKRAGLENGAESGNVEENAGGYLHDAGMSLKGQGLLEAERLPGRGLGRQSNAM